MKIRVPSEQALQGRSKIAGGPNFVSNLKMVGFENTILSENQAIVLLSSYRKEGVYGFLEIFVTPCSLLGPRTY